MSQHKIKQIHFVYGIVLAALVILLGAALVLSCLSIYHSSEHDPYSPASVAQAFDRISILIWVTAAAIIGGIILELALPLEGKRPKAIANDGTKLKRLHQKLLSSTSVDQDLLKKNLSRRRRQRRILALVPCILSGALIIYPAYYFSDPGHFTIADLNRDITKAVLVVLIPAVLALGCFYLFSFLIRKNMRKEADFCKLLLAENTGNSAAASKAEPVGKKWVPWCIRGGLLLLAAGFIAVGIANGGAQDVLKKAIAICTECIGLG